MLFGRLAREIGQRPAVIADMEMWEADDVLAYLAERDGRGGPSSAQIDELLEEALPATSPGAAARARAEMKALEASHG